MSITDKAKNILLVLVSSIVWITFISKFIQWITQETWEHSSVYNIPAYLFFTCMCAPIFEELMFRHVPLRAAKLFNNQEVTTLTVIMSSLIFGWLHGHGWISVLMQGTIGLGLCYTYLKNNYCYWSSVITHALYNLVCLFFPF